LCDHNIIYFCMHIATGIHDINKREWFLNPSSAPQEERISFLNWTIEKANFVAGCDNMALRLSFHTVIYFRWKYLALWVLKVLFFGGLTEQPVWCHVTVKILVLLLFFTYRQSFRYWYLWIRKQCSRYTHLYLCEKTVCKTKAYIIFLTQ
jgi:hypothetical protein